MASFRTKYKFYKEYRKNLLSNKEELASEFGIRIDFVNRFYTVLNIPKELIEEPYDLRKADIDALAGRYIKEYATLLGQYLSTKNMNELWKVYKTEKVGKFSYLIVFGYSQFDTAQVAKNIYYRIIPITLGVTALSWILFKIFG